ncbi:MAG: hypothetical protein LH613_13780 [Chamaesiphon sp.]|nr:hypothetical protein [Chamaesiphon sp.]
MIEIVANQEKSPGRLDVSAFIALTTAGSRLLTLESCQDLNSDVVPLPFTLYPLPFQPH